MANDVLIAATQMQLAIDQVRDARERLMAMVFGDLAADAHTPGPDGDTSGG